MTTRSVRLHWGQGGGNIPGGLYTGFSILRAYLLRVAWGLLHVREEVCCMTYSVAAASVTDEL